MAGGPQFVTAVAFVAHPDDESLLMGGALAQLASAGHRVVLVAATCGERGLAGAEDGVGSVGLATVRLRELEQAAAALGCARVVVLGYGDSGLVPDPVDQGAFAHVDVEQAAMRLAALLQEERADVLLVNDHNGGYGHPDHIQVHRVGSRAAVLAGTPLVLEATVPGLLFRGVMTVLRGLGHALGHSAPLATRTVFADRGAVTHRIRVTGWLDAKRDAMRAHGSQTRGSGQPRVLQHFLRLPAPLFALAFGHEWFIEQGRAPGRIQTDLLASLRGR